MGALLFNARAILNQPVSRQNWYKKVSIWPFVFLLGFPFYVLALCFTLLPLLMGSAMLFSQVQLYLQDGHWSEFSLLDAATETVDAKLAAKLREPLLSSCAEEPRSAMKSTRELRAGVVVDGALEIRKRPKASCLRASAMIAWLDEPDSWLGVHKIVVPPMSILSVPVLFSALVSSRGISSVNSKRLSPPDPPPLFRSSAGNSAAGTIGGCHCGPIFHTLELSSARIYPVRLCIL